jgi:serine/threonine-protein kinase
VPERYLGQTLGKYRIESLLGSGGFAWVFKGHDPELDIPVAIKVLKPQFAGDQAVVDRFKREASTAAKLRHPNIIKIYAVGREKDAVYFVMDFLPSGLATRLEATQSLPEDYVLRVGVDVARALGFAHREGVIHRDIKVDNILFDSHGNAIVADFGIARALSGYTNQTGTNMVVGTPQYFAPEQARAKPLDGRADLYSLGVTLYRAATGRLPFEGEDWYEIARQHVEEPAPSPRSVNPALSPEFEAIVLQLMAKAPDDRPATGDVLAETISGILQMRRDPSSANTLTVPRTPTGTIPAIPSANGKAVPTPIGRRRLVSGAVVASVVVAGVAALLWLPLGNSVSTTNAATDSLVTPDSGTVGVGNDTGTVGDTSSGVPAGRGSPPLPKGTIPGKTNQPVTTARPTTGIIVVRAPDDARITIKDQEIGFGDARRDSLAPGLYVVRAELPAIEGCDAARSTATVTVRAGATHPVTLAPKLCGRIELNVIARRNNSNVAQTIWYTLQPEGGEAPREITLTPGPKVVPVGKYRLRVSMMTCQPYDESIEIIAGELLKVPIVMLCPED